MERKTPNLRFTFGPGNVAVRRDGASSSLGAGVLGREVTRTEEVVYLDRLVHRPGDLSEEWGVGGCLTTILRRENGSVMSQKS